SDHYDPFVDDSPSEQLAQEGTDDPFLQDVVVDGEFTQLDSDTSDVIDPSLENNTSEVVDETISFAQEENRPNAIEEPTIEPFIEEESISPTQESIEVPSVVSDTLEQEEDTTQERNTLNE